MVKMRGGVTLVRPEDRKTVENMYSEKISQWRKRKRMFKDLWDAITENSPKDLKEFKVLYIFTYCKAYVFQVVQVVSDSGYVFAGGTWNRI